MSNKRNSSSSSGTDILGVVQIVFITLKLIGVIDWSWPNSISSLMDQFRHFSNLVNYFINLCTIREKTLTR